MTASGSSKSLDASGDLACRMSEETTRPIARSATDTFNCMGFSGSRLRVNTFRRLATSSTLEGVTALYTYEVQQPEVASQKRDGLRTHYGINSDQSLTYFNVQAEADIAHRQEEREVLRHCLDDGGEPGSVIQAATESLNAYWELLDGVCEETAVPMN